MQWSRRTGAILGLRPTA